MPAPHRFERMGLAEFDLLVDGLTGLERQVVTYRATVGVLASLWFRCAGTFFFGSSPHG